MAILADLFSVSLRIWITKAGLIFAATSNQWDYFNSKVNLYGNDGSLLVPNILGNQYNSEPPMPVILTESEGGNRYLLIDEQGKIVADSLQILSDYRNTSLEKEDAKYIRMTQAENADYFIVEIYDKQINRIVMQVLDKNGRFILNNWIESNSNLTSFFYSNHEQWIMPSNYIFSDDGLWFLNVTDGQTKWTDIYSMPDGRYIAQIPYRVTNVYPYGNLLLCDSGSIIAADIDGNVVNSYQSASHCSDGLNRYAILFDGVYYGVLTESGFVGDGVSYSRVSYNQDERLFTLSKGANNESYRYNPDGSVIKIS